LRHYATNQKVEGSRPDEVSEFSIYLILPAAKTLGFTQPLTKISTRKSKIVFLGSKAQPVRGADNLTAIGEPNI
jgi:hypothetical protein